MTITKKVKLNLYKIDGNAFSLMGAWRNQAEKEGWTKEETEFVIDKCMSGDYNNLVATLKYYCK